MQPGDLVRYRGENPHCFEEGPVGLVVRIDDSHRQTTADVLFSDGLKKRVWVQHLEVDDES